MNSLAIPFCNRIAFQMRTQLAVVLFALCAGLLFCATIAQADGFPTREQAKKEADEAYKFKLMEAEQTISAMQKQVEELKRKAEQGSQQLQGEVQELELEAPLAIVW